MLISCKLSLTKNSVNNVKCKWILGYDRERTLFAQLASLRASGAARGGAVGAGGTLGALKQ